MLKIIRFLALFYREPEALLLTGNDTGRLPYLVRNAT